MATLNNNVERVVEKDGVTVTWSYNSGSWLMTSWDITDIKEFVNWLDDNGYLDFLVEESDLMEHWEV